jgi:hypothetical protein
MQHDEGKRAEHGPQSEVTWDDGKGRQPYANQGSEEQSSGGAAEEEAGNRGNASGRNLDQLEQVKERPDEPRR